LADQHLYETVVGLEVHAQLLTKSKLFCGDAVDFNAEPNTLVSPITLGHPGTLPKLNRKAIEYAIRMGLACHCGITRDNYFARKNYFYPDLPKGYQVSQHTTPICTSGYIMIQSPGGEKKIRLNRIHLEEDAGKSLHDLEADFTCIDFNRAGTPLIEIVSEPDLRNGDEAYSYLTEIRKLVRYLEICDGNMEEGSLRCDANISVRLKGESRLGTRVEVKNLNSIRNVKRAIECETERLIGLLQKGETILQQTRSFDADKGITFAIRDKEEADDYRYFPDPDLTLFHLREEFIEKIRAGIPALQAERIKKYINEWQLSEYDAQVLTEEKNFADYFEEVISCFTLPKEGKNKLAANWMQGPVKAWLNEHSEEMHSFPVPASQTASLITLIDDGKLSFSVASTRLLALLLKNPGKEPGILAAEHQLIQDSDASVLEPIINNVLDKLSDKVMEYKKGKKGLLALFVGEIMKRTKGKADPKLINELLIEKLKT
jgi:aspartyl-tRNA(Asn)/glutamyl-tRNA(Gln) amidotransferase subunit B